MLLLIEMISHLIHCEYENLEYNSSEYWDFTEENIDKYIRESL